MLIIFLPMVLAVLAGVHRYLWIRLVRDTGLTPRWRRVATWALVVLALTLPATMALSRHLDPDVARRLLFLPYLWMGMLLYLVLVCLTGDLLRLARWARARLSGGAAQVDPGRRLFMSRAVAVTAATGGLGIAAISQRNAMATLSVRRVEVTLRRLPAALDGATLVQLTDLHIGPLLGRRWLEGVVERTLALRPDMVAITGDLVDGSVDRLSRDIAPLGLLDAPMGVYFVTGNHEYYSGAEHWLAKVRSMGIRPLRNERVSVGRGSHSFDLVGVDDYNARRMMPDHGPDLARAVAGRDPDRELVLLAHQPREIHRAARLGVGLQLSGHTHGGQIWPWGYMVYLQQPYVAGLFDHQGTQIYVSEGTGFWGPPMRVATRCEITHITLRAAAGARASGRLVT